jgi:hypothetical protein
VLSNPVCRHSYDEQCHRGPLIEAIELTPPGIESSTPLITDSPEVRPSAAALLDRLRRNFTRIGVPKDEHVESLTVEVPVAPEDIRQHRPVRIAFPVFEPCRACSGRGRIDLFQCSHCAGEGLIETAQSLWEPIEVRSIIERSLAPFGIENLYLRLLFAVR